MNSKRLTIRRVVRGTKVILKCSFRAFILIMGEFKKICKHAVFLQVSQMENYISDLEDFGTGKQKDVSSYGEDLGSNLDKDFSKRNELWERANTHYHESNWIKARSELLSADQIQEQAAMKLLIGSENVRFIGSNITGSIGHLAIAMGLRARMRLLGESKQQFLVICSKSANKSLLQSWEKFFPVLRVSHLDASAIERNFWPLFDHVQTVKTTSGTSDLISAHNRFARAYELESKTPLLELSKEIEEQGLDAVKKWGWNPDGWFVTIHVRENKDDRPGYGRNANPNTYLPAIQKIIDLGGTVVRIGNRKMSALPQIDGFVDLTQSPNTSDSLDLFLMARCKFFIGTTSGPMIVPTLFGTPVLATNAPDLGKFVYLPKGVMIPKRVKNQDGQLLDLKQQLHSPAGFSDSWLDGRGSKTLTWVENSSDEILNAVHEMLNDNNAALDSNQKQAINLVLQSGATDTTPIAKCFFDKNIDFLS